VEGPWIECLTYCHQKLQNKANSPYLVGNDMTVADITMGAHFLRLCYNPSLPEQGQFQEAMQNYPLVKDWAENVICFNFQEWFNRQPKSQMIM